MNKKDPLLNLRARIADRTKEYREWWDGVKDKHEEAERALIVAQNVYNKTAGDRQARLMALAELEIFLHEQDETYVPIFVRMPEPEPEPEPEPAGEDAAQVGPGNE